MGLLLTRQEELELQRQPDETFITFVFRVGGKLQFYDIFYRGEHTNTMFGENPSECVVKAWDGERYIEMLRPDSDYRSDSYNQGYVPPFHLRTLDDEQLYAEDIVADTEGQVSGHDYYATIAEASAAAQQLADFLIEGIQIINCFSNSVEIVEPKGENVVVAGNQPQVISTRYGFVEVSHDGVSITPREGYAFGPGATGMWYNVPMEFTFTPLDEVDENDLYSTVDPQG